MGELMILELIGAAAAVAVAVALYRRRLEQARAFAAAAADVPERLGRCPVCVDKPLLTRQTEGEARCGSCDGCLLAPDRARDLVFSPRALTPGALAAVGTGRGVAEACPACGAGMKPVLVDDDVIDVCMHCGAIWCDMQELPRLLRQSEFDG